MIELEVQFQVVIASIVFAMTATNLYTFIEILFKKSKVFRSFLELCFFIMASVCYYALIFVLNKGILNVYMPICLILGYYLHMKFYDKYFSCLYDYLFTKVSSIINKKKARVVRVWKEVIAKMIKREKSTE